MKQVYVGLADTRFEIKMGNLKVDKSKAFDTVPHHILRLALKRIRVPDAFIELYCDSLLAGRTARIKTEYGLTDPIHMHRGMRQGAVEWPLMWAIFDDVLLSKVNRVCPGVTLYARKGETGDPELAPSRTATHRANGEVVDTAQLAAMAYVDDTAFFAPNRLEMEQLLRIVSSFNRVTAVKANASKGAMLVLNCKGEARGEPLTVEGEPIPFLAREAFENELRKGHGLLKNKAITGKMAVYFANNVIYPAALYRTSNFVPPPAVIDTWDAKFRSLIRQKLGVDRSTSSALIHHPSIHDLDSLSNLIVRHHVTELAVMLNDRGPLGTPARVCLGLAAWALAMPCSPLAYPTPEAPSSTLCWFANLLPLMHAANISVVDTHGEFAIDPGCHHSPLFLSEDDSLAHRNPAVVRQLRKHGLYRASQFAPEGQPVFRRHVEAKLNLNSLTPFHESLLRRVQELRRHPIRDPPWPLLAQPEEPFRPWLFPSSALTLGRYLAAGVESIAVHSIGVMLPSVAPGAMVTMYTDGSVMDTPQNGSARPVGAGVHAFVGMGVDEEKLRVEAEYLEQE